MNVKLKIKKNKLENHLAIGLHHNRISNQGLKVNGSESHYFCALPRTPSLTSCPLQTTSVVVPEIIGVSRSTFFNNSPHRRTRWKQYQPHAAAALTQHDKGFVLLASNNRATLDSSCPQLLETSAVFAFSLNERIPLTILRLPDLPHLSSSQTPETFTSLSAALVIKNKKNSRKKTALWHIRSPKQHWDV